MKWFRRNSTEEPPIRGVGVRELFLSSINGILNGKLLVVQIQRHKGLGLMLFFCCLIYIYHGFEVERLFDEKAKLEKEVVDLRFISNTVAADLMFSKKKSEVTRKIKEAGLTLESAQEPPFKLYAK